MLPCKEEKKVYSAFPMRTAEPLNQLHGREHLFEQFKERELQCATVSHTVNGFIHILSCADAY